MNKYIELAKKLKALADKGVGGEKLNAKNMLDSLLKKHGLTIDDIEIEKESEYFFKLKPDEHRLWNQIVHSVRNDIKCYGKFPQKDIKQIGLSGNYCIISTLAEYIEIEAKFKIFMRLYRDELNIFYHSFCTANNLLVDPKNPITIDELTEDELKTLKRINQMSKNIKTEQYRKQLSPGYIK